MSSPRKVMSMIAMVISLAAISFAQEIKTDYDRNAEFSQYKTFSFEKIQTKNPLWVDRITSAIGAALTEKGLTQVASGGDISIVAIEMTKEQQTLNTFYDNFGGGWDGVGVEGSEMQRQRPTPIGLALSLLTYLTQRAKS